MLSTQHKFLFIHIPKTAGNAIQQALIPFSEDTLITPHAHQDGLHSFGLHSDNLAIKKHSTLAEYQQQLDEELFSRLFKFTCIRNPWERCISYYFSPHRGQVRWSKRRFSEFIERAVKPSDYYAQLPGSENADAARAFDAFDCVLRYENLLGDFSNLCQRLGIPERQLQHLNTSTAKEHRNYYDEFLKQQVAKLFAVEIERFGFRF